MKHRKSLNLPQPIQNQTAEPESNLPKVKPRELGSGSRKVPAATTFKKNGQTTNTKAMAQPKALAEIYDLPFVELLAKSNFSFLQGASHPEEMALQAQALGYRGLGLCDCNGFYGIVRAWQAIEFPSNFTLTQMVKRSDFSFYSGAEMTLEDRSAIVLMPMHKDGYTHLCRLITLSKRRSPKGFSQLGISDLAENADDLIAFALPPWNEERLKKLAEIFGDRLYLPVWKDYTWTSLELYRHALELEKMGLQLIATQRPLMHARERKPLHDVLTCILHKTTLKEAKARLTTNSERHLKSLQELRSLWTDRLDLVTKTVEVAKRLEFSLKELHYEYPQATLPEGREPPEYLREKVFEGLKLRFPDGTPEKVLKTVEHELKLIAELRYEDYFLTLWDICLFAKRKGILHQGRGSAANSVVCYALGLTAVDPTLIELLFERFLSKERGEPPDIDIDFESTRREEVIQHIYEKYGSEHAAMVCTVICYRSRMAVRECAKVLEIPTATIEKMVRYMGREGLSRLEEKPEIATELGIARPLFDNFLRVALALRGFPRHLGIHTGGFLIAKRPITECVPVEKATMDKRYVIQWNKDDLTILKMLKIDVLGLGMLEALRRSFAIFREHKIADLDLYNIPQDDKPTYTMIQKADTVGTFQIESRAQMSLLPRLKPKCYYDLVVEVAIVRPGPIQGGMIHPYIKRRHGQEPVTYAHPALKPILEKTFGVPIFQEQIMQIASVVCGFTPGEADELRRIMSSSWKQADLMKGLRERLLNGMLNHGIKIEYAEQIYQTIVGFATYGFPESHSASFALITYASCYIKCHYPEVFVCSLLNAQPMGFYSPRALVADAQRHKVKFLELNLQNSDYEYQLEMDAHGQRCVRVGFQSVYGIKEKHIEKLLSERTRNGPFENLEDLVKRTHLNKSTLMLLGAAGALRGIGIDAREALWRIQALKLDPQSLFFGQYEPNDEEHIPEETNWEHMHREYHTKGYSLTRHPLLLLRPGLSRPDSANQTVYSKATELAHLRAGQWVRIAGLLSLQQRPPTAKGLAFLTLEDETALFNVVLMPDIYEKFRLVIADHPLLEISGSIEKKDGVIHIRARDIRPLPINDLLPLKLPPALPASYTS
jgi:DNA polymerase-3 subunit alpha/error-prone DNA polymerase